VKHVKFTISPLFLLFGAFLFYFNFGSLFAAYVLTIILHELGHAYVAKKLGYQLNSIKLMPYGTELSVKTQINNFKDDLLISLAGPFVNLVLIILTLALWWLFPTIYIYTELFFIANLISLLFNLLPVFPLDGGRVVLNLLSRKINRESAYKIMQTFGSVVAILFFLMFLVSAFYKLNITFFIISFFLMESSLSKNEHISYQTIFIMGKSSNTLKKPKAVKLIALPEATTLLKAARQIQSHYFTVFYVLDKEQKIKHTLTQEQLKKLILQHNPSSSFDTL
jgi:stage IV sporulation protein FB